MKIDFTQKELRDIKRSLQNRVEDLRRYAFEADNRGKSTLCKEFTDMANDCAAVLKKIKDYEHGRAERYE